MKINCILPSFALLLLTLPASAQLGGLVRNAEPYWTLETSYGTLNDSSGSGADLRVAWGNDFDATSLEVGLALLGNKGATGEDVMALDVTMLSESHWGDLDLDLGFALEMQSSDSGEDFGFTGLLELSLRETPEPWDPYLLIRARSNSWDAGVGVRWRY